MYRSETQTASQEYPVFSPLDRDLYCNGNRLRSHRTISDTGSSTLSGCLKLTALCCISCRGRCSDRPASPDVPRDRKPRDEPDPGVDLINEKIHMTTLPCIFVSTILSQAVGASAGKEGAALQIGGCIGNYLGISSIWMRGTKSHDHERHERCLGRFRTPLAAAMFGIEVISIGVAYYALRAVRLCLLHRCTDLRCARTSRGIVPDPPCSEFSSVPALYTVGLGLSCALSASASASAP